MEQVYLTEINIRQVRHLQNIKIELPQNEKKHLLITGINGCGKTSVLKAIENSFLHVMGFMGQDWKEIKFDSSSDKIDIRSNLSNSIGGKEMYKLYQEGQIILIYFSADRKFTMNKSKTVEAINIYKVKMFTEKMNTSFGQLLVYLYVEKLFAREKGDEETVKDVEKWFEWLQGALRELFDNDQLELKFLLEDMCFKIKLPGREEFGLDEMASGYEALFDLFSEIVIRMEQQAHLKYDLPGIVLIDEIELHLHIAWQKKVLPFLVRAFPNLQFIVATHSPFVVSSIESAVIYDLEKNIMVGNLSAYSYECLVESLFSTTVFSDVMGNKYGRYRELVEKDTSRSVSEDKELVDLIKYFQSIPFFVAEDIILDFQITESQRKHGKDK
ncbi:hypothetical protein D3Z60_04820 [Lachnospiraceae bacterium]|jgi:predicted ATP-binding protein involved in virulence|nr:hypothetical protein [Lachnospiraceae bacterium]